MSEFVSVVDKLKNIPKHSKVRKWQKLIDFSMQAFLASDVSMTAEKTVAFTQKIIETMERDDKQNSNVMNNKEQDNIFVYIDDSKDYLELLKSANNLMTHWNDGNVSSVAEQKRRGIFSHGSDSQEKSESETHLEENMAKISVLILNNGRYGSQYNKLLDQQEQIYTLLSLADPSHKDELKQMTRAERIDRLNKKVVATDYILRKILPFDLPDINDTTAKGQIVIEEARENCVRIRDGVENIEYALSNGQGEILLGIDLQTNYDATLDDRCDSFVLHEATHRLSDILRSMEQFEVEKNIQRQSRKLATSHGIRLMDEGFKFISIEAQIRHDLYEANLEEVCARHAQFSFDNNAALNREGLSERQKNMAEKIYLILEEAPNSIKDLASGVKNLLAPTEQTASGLTKAFKVKN